MSFLTHLLPRVWVAFLQFYQLLFSTFSCWGFHSGCGSLVGGEHLMQFLHFKSLKAIGTLFSSLPPPPQAITPHVSWADSAVDGGLALTTYTLGPSGIPCHLILLKMLSFYFWLASLVYLPIFFCFMRSPRDIKIVCCQNDFVLTGNLRSLKTTDLT